MDSIWSGKHLTPASVIDIPHESLITRLEKLNEWVEAEAKAVEWYASAARDAAWKRRTWRHPELAAALGSFIEELEPAMGGSFPIASFQYAVVEAFLGRGADKQRREVEVEEAREQGIGRRAPCRENWRRRTNLAAQARAKQWLGATSLLLLIATVLLGRLHDPGTREIAARDKLNEAEKLQLRLLDRFKSVGLTAL